GGAGFAMNPLAVAMSAEFNALGFRTSATYRMTNMARPILARTWLDSSRTIVATLRHDPQSSRRAGVRAAAGLRDARSDRSADAAGPPRCTSRHAEGMRDRPDGAGPSPHPRRLAAAYRRFCEFQEERGLVRRDAESGRWV